MKLTKKTLNIVYDALLYHCGLDEFCLQYENYHVVLCGKARHRILQFITDKNDYDWIYFKVWSELELKNPNVRNDVLKYGGQPFSCGEGQILSIEEFCLRYDLDYEDTRYAFVKQLFYRLKSSKLAINDPSTYDPKSIKSIISLEQLLIQYDLNH